MQHCYFAYAYNGQILSSYSIIQLRKRHATHFFAMSYTCLSAGMIMETGAYNTKETNWAIIYQP